MENSIPEESNSVNQPSKRKAFEVVQKNLAFVGITPNLVHQSYPINGIILFEFLLICSATYFTSVFIVYDAETFVDYTQSVYSVSFTALIIIDLLIILLKVEKLFEFINNFSKLVNTKLKYSASESIFLKTFQFEQKLSKLIFFVIIRMTPGCFLLPFLTYTYFNYFTTDLGPKAFVLPLPMWFPFDWRNPIGYLVALAIQYAMFFYAMMIVASALVLGIVSFLYVMASTKCIKGCLFSIGRCTNDNTNQTISEQFIEFIQFHSSVKQLIRSFSGIFQHFITALFVWSLVTICGALLMLQMLLLHHDVNLMMLSATVFEVIYSFGILLVACELSQQMNLAFEECNEMIDQFEWYSFPAEIQRMLPIIMYFTQQPVEIICFGSIAADRETFKYVFKNAFSYFTVLREF